SPGESISDIRVIVKFGNGVVHGTVSMTGGNIPGDQSAWVDLSYLNDPDKLRPTARPDARGRFTFEHLPAGQYEVSFQPQRFMREDGVQLAVTYQKQIITVSNNAELSITLNVTLAPVQNERP